jgi:hypothetical protein
VNLHNLNFQFYWLGVALAADGNTGSHRRLAKVPSSKPPAEIMYSPRWHRKLGRKISRNRCSPAAPKFEAIRCQANHLHTTLSSPVSPSATVATGEHRKTFTTLSLDLHSGSARRNGREEHLGMNRSEVLHLFI